MANLYRFTLNYSEHFSYHKHVLLQNYIACTCEILNGKFLDSDYKLSKEHFNDMYEYQHENFYIKTQLVEVFKLNYAYFAELSH